MNFDEFPRPAVFLDRDGVLNEERGYVNTVDELIIFPFVRKCIEELHNMGFYAIVISNQSGVARGYLTETTLQIINDRIIDETGVDAVYYCPYHKDAIIKEYRIESDCRKPGIGLIKQACRDFKIDLSKSFFVGDRSSDIQTGKNAGLKTIYITSGFGNGIMEENIEPDYSVRDLRDAVSIISF